MAGRRTQRDPSIGARIRTRRNKLDWSIRFAASRAGIDPTTWSRIEKGEMSADNRFILAAIAESLRCPVSDLTKTETATGKDAAVLDAAAYETVLAVTDINLDYEPIVTPRPVAELRREVDLIRDLHVRLDFLALNSRLPDALRELHAVALGGSKGDREQALGMLVEAADTARVAVRFTSHAASAGFIAERAWNAAQLLGDPVMIGLAGWTVTQGMLALGQYRRAVAFAERSFDTLSRHAEVPRAAEVMGQLLLCAAYAHRAMGDADPDDPRMAEVSRLAARTGETDTFSLYFGPTNVGVWHVGMEVDGGDPGKATRLAQGLNPTTLPASRQSAFYIDNGRALARLRRDEQATRQLLTAERVAPQRVQSDSLVAETARSLLDSPRRNAAATELRGLCERLGIA